MPKDLQNKYFKKTSKSSHLISDPFQDSVVNLGHEGTHARRAIGKEGKIAKKVSDLTGDKKAIFDIQSPMYATSNNPKESFMPTGSKKYRKELFEQVPEESKENLKLIDNSLNEAGIRKAAKRWIKGKLRLVEEKAATKGGIKKAKEAGVSGKALQEESEIARLGTKTYEPMVGASWKMPLRNRIQIPSQRGEWNLGKYM